MKMYESILTTAEKNLLVTSQEGPWHHGPSPYPSPWPLSGPWLVNLTRQSNKQEQKRRMNGSRECGSNSNLNSCIKPLKHENKGRAQPWRMIMGEENNRNKASIISESGDHHWTSRWLRQAVCLRHRRWNQTETETKIRDDTSPRPHPVEAVF
jgi:hypothetical protein